MTQTLDRTKTEARALVAVATATAAMVALALYALVVAAVRLIEAVTLSAESIAGGVTLPAAAVDGVSSGTVTLGLMEVTHMYDGNNLPLPQAFEYTRGLRDFLVPFEGARAIDAALILALAIVVLLLCLRLVRRKPFARHLTWSLAIFAVVVAGFSLAAQVIRRAPFGDSDSEGDTVREYLAMMMRAIQAPPIPNFSWDNDITYTSASSALDLTLLGLGVLIGLVAAAFAIGQRMQRDTEGLV